jgi:uncharacterized RDD family membrane protein YckC
MHILISCCFSLYFVAFSTRSSPMTLAAAKQSHSSSSSNAEPSTSVASGLSPAAAATFAIAVVGVVSYVLSESGKEESTLEPVRIQLRNWAARYGLTPAECDAAAAEMKPRLITSSRGPSAVDITAPSIVGKDEVLAPYWRRLLAAVFDQIFVQGILFLATYVLVKVRPGTDVFDTPVKSMSASLLLSFLLDFFGLTEFDGQTVGKYLFGVRTVRLDRESMDTSTALKASVSRLVIAPLAFIAEPSPLLLSKEARSNKQLLHNYLSNTIVVCDAPTEQE